MSYSSIKALSFEPHLLKLATYIHYNIISEVVNVKIFPLHIRGAQSVNEFYRTDTVLHTQVAERHYQVFKKEINSIYDKKE